MPGSSKGSTLRPSTVAEAPLRSELYNADQLERHGRTLAEFHRLARGRTDLLLPRLAENERVLVEIFDVLTAAVTANRRVTPAGEWLLDNFHLIEEQIRTAKQHLPKGYSRELPRLARGASAKLPRVFDLAFEAISHGDGRIDAASLSRFIAAYQTVTPLKLGELWAIPIMLRLALIENLRRIGVHIASGTVDRNRASAWADQMMQVAKEDPKNLILVIADMARSNPPMASPFVAELARRLQGQSAALALPLTWIEQRLFELGLTIERLVQSETMEQAGDQVSISNTIGSLRLLESMDWRDFVESLSSVERQLREDPSGIYARMDFATRDRYRHVVEEIARRSPHAESEVARKAIALATERSAASVGRSVENQPEAHVGFYLLDSGRQRLERESAVRRSVGAILAIAWRRLPLSLYLGAIAALTVGATAFVLLEGRRDGVGDGLLLAFGVLLAVVISQLAGAVVNWIATLAVRPRLLPRLDYSEGLPARARTLVVVPTLLTSVAAVESLVEALEVRFLANQDQYLHFALLTDFPDSAEETDPGDDALLRLVQARIESLNEKYDSAPRRSVLGDAGNYFYLLHRPRLWNEKECVWMGYERKRGKLAALNALLRGKGRDAFSHIVGDTTVLSDVAFVITLDTDTQLPRDAARQLVGVMAHPLNRSRVEASGTQPATGLANKGYGILQPRVSISLLGASRTWYARMQGGDPGIDPYTRAVSDVYQDLFGQGSFIGKGIYDVDAFERAVQGRFPENRILSHDLLEGCYARSGLVSDVQLYEEQPATYAGDMLRRHRWIRGDWQLAAWLLPRVPGPGGLRQRNPLSALSRWKLFDNLRRSLVAPAMTLLLILGWTVVGEAWLWTAIVFAVFLFPSLSASILDLLRRPGQGLRHPGIAAILAAAASRAAQTVVAIALLPYEATVQLDAIARSAWRLFVSHRHLLEWQPSVVDATQRRPAGIGTQRNGLAATCRSMWIAPFIATGTALLTAATAPPALAMAAPVLACWLVSPAIAWWISRPLARGEVRLTRAQSEFLRTVARRTWAFFEVFVGPADHWLPPDNYQEHPVARVAHRTSPTNMGLALLANLAAHDFGYIPAGQLVRRTAEAMQTMKSLERYAGHFYNWYDTQTLEPLSPRYVSSVDSGNLAGHLMTMQPGLAALADDGSTHARWVEGLVDTVRALAATVAVLPPPSLARLRADLERARDIRPAKPQGLRELLDRVDAGLADARIDLDCPVAEGPENASDGAFWLDALAGQCVQLRDELALLAPWTALPSPPPALAYLVAERALPTLRTASEMAGELSSEIERVLTVGRSPAEKAWLEALRDAVATASQRAAERLAEIDILVLQCEELARMDYEFLYDRSRHLLAIGYNVSEGRRDSGSYDLLASEARFASFVAISQGQIPQENWFALGRTLATAGGQAVLQSWSGSMFEYLMPLLIMPTYPETLLDQTCHATVARQIAYGKQRGVPWGISESGYNTVDTSLNYQYRAFGVPGLGLKRGLADDLVVAPYASALALMVAPEESCSNLQRLAADGLAGRFGLREAIDYSPSRLVHEQDSAVVRSYMAHHQGMVLLSLAYLLLARPMQRRFESHPMFKASLLLLQERIPRVAVARIQRIEVPTQEGGAGVLDAPVRVFDSPDTPSPEVQLLSNGRYHVMVTNAGGGSTRWKDLAVTRWREDGTRDHWGTFCYVRDVASGTYWSTAHQPTLKRASSYQATFTDARAEFRRRDGDFESYTEIVVSPEDDIDLRRTRITNRGATRRTIDVTSYAEIVLAAPAADALHPAFSNLFVQTEVISASQAILCTRRPRSLDEHAPWMFHLMAVRGADSKEVSYETDRMQFIGRGRSPASPLAMTAPDRLSGSQGSVLDPIVAIRHRLVLDPQQTATIDLATGVADTREAVLGLVGKYRDRHLADRVFELAWTHSWVTLRQINATESDAQLYARLASTIIYGNASLRAPPSVLQRNQRGQSGLWSYAISGDLPIVLVQIGDGENIELVRSLVQAHAYWRLKGLVVDLVIWNEDRGGYRQVLQDQIMGLIAAGVEAHAIDRPGGIFVRRADQISHDDRDLLQSASRAIFNDRRGSLAEQVSRLGPAGIRIPALVPSRIHHRDIATPAPPARALLLENGLGGFAADGSEYVITLQSGETTPTPWVNVLANPYFGTVISESGSAYTWSENAHEFRLTPWHNDPVTDASGEACFLRDEESGRFWSPTPLPRRGNGSYVTRHGFGYSIFEHGEDGIHTELRVYVAIDAPVKFWLLKLRNASGRVRRLSATGYVEWVLGDLRAKTSDHVITDVDAATGALMARNAFNTEFPNRVAFFDVDDPNHGVSGDRAEFLGRNGSLKSPAAMSKARLSGRVGAALDPCGALQLAIELADGQEKEVVFRLGVGRDNDAAGSLIHRFRGVAAAHRALAAVRAHWRHTLGAVQVATPDVALNVMANGWLLYQTIACRIWARSGFYQSGGAFGFRDQLQDAMALVHAEPALLREQLLRCAGQQFTEGDVQHWWHPPSGRGVRTRCSDDFLWLPLATARYLRATGDTTALDESIHFLEGRPVSSRDDSYYDLPSRSGEAASLYEHCVRAVVHGLRYGEHGLPLMGSGDWNDGMNLVGIDGAGESVWLGFFLVTVLREFSGVARGRGDGEFAGRCEAEARRLGENLDREAWDGEWYRRAYFDDGSPLGSAINDECRIDSVTQSWSVLSGTTDAHRSRMAMKAVDRHLVRRDHRLIQLLDPPFDHSTLNPGYIRGYVPGVRENGGQYTHAAIWVAMAFAKLGERDLAWELASMLNPAQHASSPDRVATYKLEPYVVAADVYALPPHVGRGGWSWYTGSAGWMYRLLVESLLGLRRECDTLRVQPVLPREWTSFELQYRYRGTSYGIQVIQADAGASPTRDGDGDRVTVDGTLQSDSAIHLVDDRRAHHVVVEVRVPVERVSDISIRL